MKRAAVGEVATIDKIFTAKAPGIGNSMGKPKKEMQLLLTGAFIKN